MKIGDVVKWSSQAGGYMKSKQGIIVEVVPGGERPKMNLRDLAGLLPRKHESYVVHVGSGLGKKNYYWPVVSGLELVSESAVQAKPAEPTIEVPKKGPKLFFIPHIGGGAE